MGSDQIPNEFLKHLPISKREEILSMINKYWEEGVFPQEAKNALVIPLLKENKNPSELNS